MPEEVRNDQAPAPTADAQPPRPEEHLDPQANGAPADGTPELDAIFRRAMEASRRPLPEEMSIRQAAEFLDVEVWRILRLLKKGGLPYRVDGKRRRIPTAALLEQREKQFQAAKAAMDEMCRISQELGLDDLVWPPKEP